MNRCKSGLLYLGALMALAVSLRAAEPVTLLGDLSPDALVATRDGRTLYVACAGTNVIWAVDTATRQPTIAATLPIPASGLVLSPDDHQLYITCPAAESRLVTVDLRQHRVTGNLPLGHTALAPVITPDGKTLCVCDRFNNAVSLVDLATGRETARVPVEREPVAADLTRDGKYLLVANHLAAGRANTEDVDAGVSVVDVAAGRTVKQLELPDGSDGLQALRVSPDGKYAVLLHLLSNFDVPTRHIEHGQINANALTIIDVAKLEPLTTFYLDTLEQGAGNPWAMAWSADGNTLAVTHAGTHEVSVIDFPALLAGLPHQGKARFQSDTSTDVLKFAPHYEDDEIGLGFPFLVGARTRVQLPAGNYGPRAVTFAGSTLFVANYFSDTLNVIAGDSTPAVSATITLGAGPHPVTAARRGEFYFHDAALSRQGWQSCASCHPGDARADGLNWQLGRNHPKNTRSLLLSDQTACLDPLENGSQAMAANSAAAVRLSLEKLLFAPPDEAIAADLDAYIASLRPVTSPWLENGQLSASARRGVALFTQCGCATCHPPGLYTDRRLHDVGTGTRFDLNPRFLTPTLVEVWRTAPYFHNGTAVTLRELLTGCNPSEARHGDVRHLNRRQIDDLCAYVLSL